MPEEEYYIEDNDLIDLLKDVLGEKITDEDIEKILKASEDGEISEEDFDNLVDEILSRSRDNSESCSPEPIVPRENKGFVYLSTSPDTCPVCGNVLSDDFYCPTCNIKFSFVSHEGEKSSKK
ncbi:MAG: hypothetical protein K6A34_05565 [Methanobrevibacter sp.]|nr:hypothetical protein [Methanobrevibacter sp.]